ncbi:MAG: endonuclease [Thermoprotei archaeon]|nr:MAG: endonuclease [Thermoprotei archaeon]
MLQNCTKIIEFDPNKCVGICKDKVLTDALDRRWFGRRDNDKLILSTEELAYLLLKNQVCIRINNNIYDDLSKLMNDYYSCFQKMFWPRLLVYNDLRSRGRRVRVLEDGKFLVKHKDNTLRLLVVLEEKQLVSASHLLDLVRQAQRNGLIFIAAIVSLQGDLTYYELNVVDLRRD